MKPTVRVSCHFTILFLTNWLKPVNRHVIHSKNRPMVFMVINFFCDVLRFWQALHCHIMFLDRMKSLINIYSFLFWKELCESHIFCATLFFWHGFIIQWFVNYGLCIFDVIWIFENAIWFRDLEKIENIPPPPSNK